MFDNYLKDTSSCPRCHSSNISGMRPEIDDSTAFQVVECHSCGLEWKDVYSLVGIDIDGVVYSKSYRSKMSPSEKEMVRGRIEYRTRGMYDIEDSMSGHWYQEIYYSSMMNLRYAYRNGHNSRVDMFMMEYAIRKLKQICKRNVEIMWIYYDFFKRIGEIE